MACRRTTEQRDRRLTRVRHIAQAITVAAGIAGSAGVGILSQTGTTAGAAATTTTSAAHATNLVKAATPVKAVKASTPAAVPAAAPVVCTTSPSGTVTCH